MRAHESGFKPTYFFSTPVGNNTGYELLGMDLLSQAREVAVDFRSMHVTLSPRLESDKQQMSQTRNRFQKGSVRRVPRKSGPDVWEYRYRDHTVPGNPMRQITLSTLEFPTETKALIHLQQHVLCINGPKAYRAQNEPTLGLVINRFMKDERISDILKQKPGETTITDGISYSTAAGYRSYIKNHIEPMWAHTPLTAVKALQIVDWLNSLSLSPKTRGQVRALMHLLFEKAMLWELIELQRNPLELVRLRGTSRRQRKPQILAPEKFQELVAVLREPYKTMTIVAMCTGLRVSELLALRWEHIDFENSVMLVQQGVVNGRIGRVKTEASQDEVPLDPAFAAVLLDLKGQKFEGLVFPSPLTGRPFYAGIIQR
jgi:integrase